MFKHIEDSLVDYGGYKNIAQCVEMYYVPVLISLLVLPFEWWLFATASVVCVEMSSWGNENDEEKYDFKWMGETAVESEDEDYVPVEELSGSEDESEEDESEGGSESEEENKKVLVKKVDDFTFINKDDIGEKKGTRECAVC